MKQEIFEFSQPDEMAEEIKKLIKRGYWIDSLCIGTDWFPVSIVVAHKM